MRKHFFCAKNIADYRKTFADIIAAEKIFDLTNVRTQRDLDQNFFAAYTKALFNLSDDFFDSPLACETDIDGLRLDFNFGLRLDVPAGNFHVTISDADSGQIFCDGKISDCRLISVEQHFIRWKIDVRRDGRKIFSHTLDLSGQPVLLSFHLRNALGDLIALLPFADEFKRRHCCELSIYLPKHLRKLAANLYPDLVQVDAVSLTNYATYYPVMSMAACRTAPVDIRNMPMERAGGTILGLETLPTKATFKPTAPPVTREPYVCIGVQASTTTKGWLYPGGWDIVVDFLKNLGYRVFCIDKNARQTNDGITICRPDGAEDFTGDFSIMERANMLYHAEFFIGLSSGLAWLANAVNCPVVMIGGFSQDWFEFYTPYRVANRLVCNGCLNDVRLNFRDVCPLHKGTSRELECQKKISPRQVLNAIERLIVERNLTTPKILTT